MFNIVAGTGYIPCTAAGTNTVTLTPNTNEYLPASYQNYQGVTFKAVATSTGTIMAGLGGLTPIAVYKSDGTTPAAAGDFVNGTLYQMFFASNLASGAGGWIITNTTLTANTPPLKSAVKNLVITTISTTQITVTADEIVLENSSNGTVRVLNVNVTINIAGAAGANSIDTGAVAAASFYSIWVIYNASSVTTAGLASLSVTAPTLPAGYTYAGRVGWVQTGGNTTNLNLSIQKGARFQFTSATNATGGVTVIPLLVHSAASGQTVSNAASIAWTTQQVNSGGFSTNTSGSAPSGWVPPTAGEIIMVAQNSYNNNTAQTLLVAPSSGYAGYASTQTPPIVVGGGTAISITQSLLLESVNIFYANTTGGGAGNGAAIFTLGWIDEVVS